MYKLKFFLIICLISLTFTGCTFLVSNSDNTEKIDTQNAQLDKEQQNEHQENKIIQNDKIKKQEKVSEERIEEYEFKEKTGEDEQPEQQPEFNQKALEIKKLDPKLLDELDNNKKSWWIKLNDEHKTPTVPSDVKKMLEEHDGIYVGDTSEKVIYLTFDEGYENGYTPKILDTLKENDVKAIFFVTGSYIDRNPELVERMLHEGHQVGNHTINHYSLPEIDYETMEKELYGLEQKLYSKFKTRFKYVRPPKGEYSERTLEAVKQLGYKTVFWSFAYRDWEVDNQKGADNAYNMVMNNLHNGAVFLLHAVSKDNAEALDRIIKDIKQQGYEIRGLDL